MASDKKKTQRTKAENAEVYGTKVEPIKPGQSEVDYFKQLAKRADQRLVRLERLAQQDNYKGVLSFSYQAAMYDIKALSGNPNATRFNIALKKNKDGTVNQQLLHAKINAVKKFLEAPTSMKSTIELSYKKRADTINAKYGTNFTWQELARFFESKTWEKLKVIIRSDWLMKLIGFVHRVFNKDDIQKGIDQNKKLDEDSMMNEVYKRVSRYF